MSNFILFIKIYKFVYIIFNKATDVEQTINKLTKAAKDLGNHQLQIYIKI
jgi:hypothetical protein